MKKIFDKILDPILYLVFAGSISFSACTIFQATYYKGIWVTGSSMDPTLTGYFDHHSYGYEDKHQSALDNLQRFDVITTYWPDSWNNNKPDASDKIKRLWGLPGETISLKYENNHFTFIASSKDNNFIIESDEIASLSDINNMQVAKFTSGRRIFNTKIYYDKSKSGKNGIRNFDIELADDEYFVMGDNWIDSNDSYEHAWKDKSSNIQRKNLQGKVICIQGYAKYDSAKGKLYDKVKLEPRFYF